MQTFFNQILTPQTLILALFLLVVVAAVTLTFLRLRQYHINVYRRDHEHHKQTLEAHAKVLNANLRSIESSAQLNVLMERMLEKLDKGFSDMTLSRRAEVNEVSKILRAVNLLPSKEELASIADKYEADLELTSSALSKSNADGIDKVNDSVLAKFAEVRNLVSEGQQNVHNWVKDLRELTTSLDDTKALEDVLSGLSAMQAEIANQVSASDISHHDLLKGLGELSSLVDGVSIELNEQTKTLSGHSALLGEHSTVLGEQSVVLHEQSAALSKQDVTEMLSGVEVTVNSSYDELSGILNSTRYQTRSFDRLVAKFESLDQVQSSAEPTSRLASVKDLVLKDKEPLTILITGMRHSGSTALFNAVRYLIESVQVDYEAGYSEKENFRGLSLRGSSVRVIKAHEFRDDLLDAADVVITTRRDVRDSVASAKRRKFNLLDRLGGAIEYAKYNCMLHSVWEQYSDFELGFEEFVENDAAELGRLALALGFKDVDVHAIAHQVRNIPTDQYDKTLLTETHQTDKNRELSFQDSLSDKEVSEITHNHLQWLGKYGFVE